MRKKNRSIPSVDLFAARKNMKTHRLRIVERKRCLCTSFSFAQCFNCAVHLFAFSKRAFAELFVYHVLTGLFFAFVFFLLETEKKT